MLFIKLPSRRVRVVGSNAIPDEAFVMQAIRGLSNAIDGTLSDGSVLIGGMLNYYYRVA